MHTTGQPDPSALCEHLQLFIDFCRKNKLRFQVDGDFITTYIRCGQCHHGAGGWHDLGRVLDRAFGIHE